MSGQRAISGTYADLKFVKTRSVAQIVVEISIEQANDFLAMFGAPQPGHEIPVALARLVEKPKEAAQKERTPFKDLPLSQQAAIRCGDEQFRRFISERYNNGEPVTAEVAARTVRHFCGVSSRAEIKWGEEPGTYWLRMEELFQEFLTTQKYADYAR